MGLRVQKKQCRSACLLVAAEMENFVWSGRLSAVGGNDRQMVMLSAESGVHAGCPPGQKSMQRFGRGNWVNK